MWLGRNLYHVHNNPLRMYHLAEMDVRPTVDETAITFFVSTEYQRKMFISVVYDVVCDALHYILR